MAFLDTPVPTVFISYSHADEEWKDRLIRQLSGLAREHHFGVWHDTRIDAGRDWSSEIEQALHEACVAVLLISADFLSSEFIGNEEVPRLLCRREHDKLPIVPVLVRACPWDEIDWLRRLQMRPKDAHPLAAGTPHEIESDLTAIVKEIAKLVRAAAAALPAGAPEATRAPREPAREREPPPVVAPPQVPTSRVSMKMPRPAAAASVVGIAVMTFLAAWLVGALLVWLRSRPVASPTLVTTLPTPDPASLPVAPPGVSLTPISFQTVRMDERGAIVERQQGTTRGFREDLGGGVTLDMVAIPGAKFLMGSPATEVDRSYSEEPQVDVTVGPFFMGKFEVTQAQWRAVATFPRVERDLDADPSRFKDADRPVEYVSWYGAVEFCKRLSKKAGRDYRLPSEAEWEYAARAGAETPFAFGSTVTPDLVNYNGSKPYGSAPKGLYRERTTKVGELGVANAFGLFDVHGNVWEWVQDVWHDNYTGRPTDERAWESRGDSTRRVLRGGAWIDLARRCRSAVRSRYEPESWGSYWGFRVVCDVSHTQ